MKWLQLKPDNTFLTFREYSDYKDGCIEVQDDFQEPPLNYIWNGSEFVAPPEPEPYQPSEQEIIQMYENALDDMINRKAQEKGYDNRITVCMRTGYNSVWQNECIRFAIWMDNCYLKAFEIMSDVKSGIRQMPTLEQFLLEMPTFSWEE